MRTRFDQFQWICPVQETIFCEGTVPDAGEKPVAPVVAVDLTATPQSLEEATAIITALREAKGEVPAWANRRIDEITGRFREEERSHAATKAQMGLLNSQIEELRKSGKVVSPAVAPEVLEQQVQQAARDIAAQQRFNDDCAAVIATGEKEFPDFQQSITKLHAVSPVLVKAANGATGPQMPTHFIEAVLEMDAPAKLLHELAKQSNHDEAARIMALPPAKQGVALAKFATKTAPAKVEVSKTAPPPETLVTGGKVAADTTVYNDKVSTKDWMEMRNKQVAEARANRRRA